MVKLTAKQRKTLPKTAFAYPASRAYPIHDRAHARAALSMSARKNTKGSYAHVRAAVAKRYPDMVSRTSKRTGKPAKRTGKRTTRGKR